MRGHDFVESAQRRECVAMKIAIHEFASRRAPVYRRPVGAGAFPVGLAPVRRAVAAQGHKRAGATMATPYIMHGGGKVAERLQLETIGFTDLRIYQKSGTGNTVISIHKPGTNMDGLRTADLAQIERVGRDMLAMFKALSNGPYSLKRLRQEGHPYGYSESWAKGNPFFRARKVPRYLRGVASIGHPKKVKGSVPTLSVVNRQSGVFERSWRWNYTFGATGLYLNFWNEAPHAWFLAHGTQRMQPHGPFNYVPVMFMPQIEAAWLEAQRQTMFREMADETAGRMLERVRLRSEQANQF